MYRRGILRNVIPRNSAIRLGNIDMLCGMVKTEIAKKIKWKINKPEADYYFYLDVSKITKRKFIEKVLGEHN